MATQVVTARPKPIEYTGLMGWLTTIDHKRIGILYGTTAFIMFLVGGLEALLMRVQLAQPNGRFLDSETYNQMFTMHGTTMIFMVVMPLSAAFFNYIVPLQIGARDVAFPRLNALSYWVFLSGTVLMNASFLFAAAPNVGWYAYAPLTTPRFSPGANVNFWILGIQLLGVGSILAALNFFVTIINLRCPGMRFMRMPVFTWMTLITSVLMLLAFPVLTIAVTQLMFDRFFDTPFYEQTKQGDPLLWQHLFWIFGHPEVYILILPAFGIISEVLPVFSRKPLFGYPVVVYSGMAIAFLGFGVWGHHMFAEGMGPIADAYFALATMVIAIPTGIKIFNWLGTMWGGALRLKVPMMFAIGFIALFTIGGISGVMHASPPVDLHHQDSYFVVAHFHYVLFGGSIFGLFAGIYYWWPKFTGRLYDEGLGKLQFWLLFIGMNLAFFPMHFLGLWGMPRRIYTYSPELEWGPINFIVTIGAFLMGLAVLLFVYLAFKSLTSGERAPNDPWDGATLEWSIPSPPPHYNFAEIPVVHSRDAWWSEKRAEKRAGTPQPSQATATGGQPPVTTSGAGIDHVDDGGHGHGGHDILMPNPSFYPILIALGLLVTAILIMINPPLMAIGILIVVFMSFSMAVEPSYSV